jgi:hypothetical protein
MRLKITVTVIKGTGQEDVLGCVVGGMPLAETRAVREHAQAVAAEALDKLVKRKAKRI